MQTLYTSETDFRSYKGRVAAAYNGVALVTKALEMGKDNLKADFLAKSPMGKIPVLETPEGSLFESNAIARYLAGLRRDTNLLGRSFFETGQVDQWLDFCAHEVELPVTFWLYPILGLIDYTPEDESRAEAQVHKALKVMESHLLSRTYFVGDAVTLADIALASALVLPMRIVLDEKARGAYPCVMRWFLTIVNQPHFYNQVGPVALCAERQYAAGASKKGGKKDKKEGGKKEGKKGGKKEGGGKKKEGKKEGAAAGGGGSAAAPAPAAAEPPKKKGGLFDDLPPSTMVLDAWKREFSNAPPGADGERDFTATMPAFWEKFYDPAGWQLMKLDYNYNEENKVGWLTSNAINGFILRTEGLRKFSFGTHLILGDKAPFKISGVWLVRGGSFEQSKAAFVEVNPDAEYYTYTPLDHTNAEHRQLVQDFWCNSKSIGGEPIFDWQLFK